MLRVTHLLVDSLIIGGQSAPGKVVVLVYVLSIFKIMELLVLIHGQAVLEKSSVRCEQDGSPDIAAPPG